MDLHLGFDQCVMLQWFGEVDVFAHSPGPSMKNAWNRLRLSSLQAVGLGGYFHFVHREIRCSKIRNTFWLDMVGSFTTLERYQLHNCWCATGVWVATSMQLVKDPIHSFTCLEICWDQEGLVHSFSRVYHWLVMRRTYSVLVRIFHCLRRGRKYCREGPSATRLKWVTSFTVIHLCVCVCVCVLL